MITKNMTLRMVLICMFVISLFTLTACSGEGSGGSASADVNYGDFFVKELGITEEQNKEYISILSECGIKNITSVIEYAPINGYNYYALATKDPNYSGIALFTDSDKNIVKVQYNSTVLYDGGKVLGSIDDFKVEEEQEEKYKELTLKLITEQYPNKYIEYINYSNGPHFAIIDPAKSEVTFFGVVRIETEAGESKYLGFQTAFAGDDVKQFDVVEMPADFDPSK